MKKIIIWDAGLVGKQQVEKYYIRPDIIGFVDNNKDLWGQSYCGINILNPLELKNIDYDYIIICVIDEKAVSEIKQQLSELNVPENKILHFSCIDKVVVCGSREHRNKFTMFHYDDYDILAYVDPQLSSKETKYYGVPLISLDDIEKLPYFGLFIIDYSVDTDIPYEKIISSGIGQYHIVNFSKFIPNYLGNYLHSCRCLWIQNYAEWINNQNLLGSVAECGVFRGDCAKFINEFFPQRKLYLFDTFDGFRHEDIKSELDLQKSDFLNSYFYSVMDCYSDTNVDFVMQKMNYPENIIIKKGYFPYSAKDIDDIFCFVNLDMDLYKPTLEALHFFWDKVVKGGCILLHDYFHPELLGVSQAVKDFEKQKGFKLNKTIIGDRCSIAILK